MTRYPTTQVELDREHGLLVVDIEAEVVDGKCRWVEVWRAEFRPDLGRYEPAMRWECDARVSTATPAWAGITEQERSDIAADLERQAWRAA